MQKGSKNKYNPSKPGWKKKCCWYLGEESMKTVLCPHKIGLRIV